jgi:uncharacterized membrane protein (UPF0127 family)
MTLDHRAVRRLLVVAVVVVLLGVYAFVLRGADEPEDPVLGPSVSALDPDAPLPGDPARVPFGDFEELAISVQPAGGGESLLWCLLAAINAEQRARGLMEVTDLQGYSGMVFVYPGEVTSRYYMRNTPTPLSIAFVAADGEVVTTTDMAPCEDREGCPTYGADAPFQYAIETFQGDLGALGITEGATVSVGGACVPRA